MTRFYYRAKEGPQKTIQGYIEAQNAEQAVAKVIQAGLAPLDISEAPASESSGTADGGIKMSFSSFVQMFQRAKFKDIVIFTRQMCDFIEGAVPILRALQIVMGQTHNKHFRPVIEDVYSQVRDGGSFSEALRKYPRYFPSYYTNLIRTGEASGQLEKVMHRLAEYMEKEQEVRARVRTSLLYPGMVFTLGVLTVFVLLTFVIPRLTIMFEDLDQALPLPTVILMGLSDFFARFWWALIGAGAFFMVFMKNRFSTSEGKHALDRFVLKVPLLKNFIIQTEMGRLTRALATLVESGVVVTDALNLVAMTLSNNMIQQDVRGISEDVRNGSSLRAALEQSVFFPEATINLISVGEETGHLEQSLTKAAVSLEQQSEQATKTFITVLSPLLLIVVVSIVGFFVMAMLLPIFQMNLIFQ